MLLGELWSGIKQNVSYIFSPKNYCYKLTIKLALEELTISEFSQQIEALGKNFTYQAVRIYQRGQASAHHTEQMTQQMDSLSGLAHAVHSSATEAQLLAVNMLVESAKQSNSSGHFVEMATHVQQLAHQSGEFSDGVLDEVDTAKMAVHQIKSLILKVSQRELDKALSVKSQIDFSLGSLSLLEEALPALALPTDHAMKIIVSLAEQVMQRLGAGLNSIKQKAELFALDEACHSDDVRRLNKIRQECERLEAARLICLSSSSMASVKKIS